METLSKAAESQASSLNHTVNQICLAIRMYAIGEMVACSRIALLFSVLVCSMAGKSRAQSLEEGELYMMYVVMPGF